MFLGKKLWSKESKAFLIWIVTKSPLVLNFLVTSSKSEMSLPDLLIYLLATYAVSWEINWRGQFEKSSPLKVFGFWLHESKSF